MQADSDSGAQPFARLLPAHGILAMRGRDALDLLHRLSTNDLVSMREDDARETLLTTEKARIIDCFLVLRRADECLLVVSPGHMERVQAWLEKFTIMEDVTYADVTARVTQCSLHQLDEASAAALFNPFLTPHSPLPTSPSPSPSPSIRPASRDSLGVTIPTPNFPLPTHHSQLPTLWETRTMRIGGFDCLVTRHDSMQGPGWHVLLLHGESDADAANTALRDALDTAGIGIIDEAQYQHWRIARAYPAAGFELTERVNPLECGASAAVSFTKGCYIGQEVIARLDAQHNVRRQLRMLRVAALVEAGSELTLDGNNGGFLTSVSRLASSDIPLPSPVSRLPSPDFFALGCVRNEYAAEGTVLIASEGESTTEVTVLAMPGVAR